MRASGLIRNVRVDDITDANRAVMLVDMYLLTQLVDLEGCAEAD